MIHFVDTEAHLISSLNETLDEPEFSPAGGGVSAWRSHCLDAAKLPIKDFPGSHLIIISGVGGDLVAHIVTQLYEQYPNAGLNFLLCPIRQNYKLRAVLRPRCFKVIDEQLIEENSLFYEAILTTAAPDSAYPLIDPTGINIWQHSTQKQKESVARYLKLLISHYSNAAKSGDRRKLEPLKLYQQRLMELDQPSAV